MSKEFSLLGVVHLLALPGTPYGHVSLETIRDRAFHDAEVILEAGFSGCVLENFGDVPFSAGAVQPHIVACMTWIASGLRERFGQDFMLGINVLRNDPQAALAIAYAAHANFIRVNVHIGAAWTDQGLIQGKAYETLLYRRMLAAQNISIAADVLVKHAHPAGGTDLVLLGKDTFLRGGADMLILTGSQTGSQTSPEAVLQLREALPQAPIWIGSGVTPHNIAQYRENATGAIIGTYLHEKGDLARPLSAKRAGAFFV